ncbi:MAG: hypothetical protein V1690_00440 [Candidatus Moraniibacteriota bacterium]
MSNLKKLIIVFGTLLLLLLAVGGDWESKEPTVNDITVASATVLIPCRNCGHHYDTMSFGKNCPGCGGGELYKSRKSLTFS